MLLAIDIGNTHVVCGLFDGDKLLASFRLQSDVHRTVDEFALQVMALIAAEKLEGKAVSQVILSCVVPALTRVFTKLAEKYFEVTPLVVGPGIKTGIVISCDDPRSVGPDRIVNAVAVKERYGTPAIVVDFGTATTFDVVSKKGSYEGGVIAPGILISADALFEKAALLPSIELRSPHSIIGKNTVDSMLAGIVYGYVGLVDGILERLLAEVGTPAFVVATGGLSQLISKESKYIKEVAPELTLTGLQIISGLNK